jgi:hypothetical protein
MDSATDGYEADEVCGKANGIPEPNNVYFISCTSCSTRLCDCPRGRYVTVKELTQSYVNLCEIKAFGLAFK